MMASPSFMSAIRRINLEDLEPTSLPYDQHIPPVAFQEILNLIATLPKLYRLDCQHFFIASEFLSAISRSPNLKFLRLIDVTVIPGIHPRIPDLHTLEYYSRAFQNRGNLLHKVDQLTTLCFPWVDLRHTLNNMPTELPRLEKLTLIYVYWNPDWNSAQEDLFNFFRNTPNLREFHITGHVVDLSLVLPDSLIPNLRSLTAPSGIAQGIVSGRRPLESIHILAFGSFLNRYNIISKGITKVAYSNILGTPQIEFSHLACMFPNVTSLRITNLGRGSPIREPEVSFHPLFFQYIDIFIHSFLII